MRHHLGLNVTLGCVALLTGLIGVGCADGINAEADCKDCKSFNSGDMSGGHYGGSSSGSGGSHSGGSDPGAAGCAGDDGSGGTTGSTGGSGGTAGNGGSAGDAGSGGTAGDNGESRADAAPVFLSALGDPALFLGQSAAWFPGNVGPNSGSIPADANVAILGTVLDLGDILLLTSRTEATSPVDCNGRSGTLGENLSFAPGLDPSEPLVLDLVSAAGPNVIPQGLLNVLHLEVGALAAETSFVDGDLQNRYRVADVDLVIGSPLIGGVSQELYDALGAIDTQVEQLINQTLSGTGGILQLIGSIPGLPAPTITVDSNLQQQVFANILAQSLTSENDAITIDLSTGTIIAHLDQLVEGGLNNQPPNTEIINADTYELLTGPVGDILHDATNVALGSVEGALSAATITVRWQGPLAVPGNTIDVTWTFTLAQALNGTLPAPTNNSSGLLGQPLGATLVTAINTLRVVDGPIGDLLQPVYDLIVEDAGNDLFELVVDDIVGDVGGSIMDLLQPVFGVAAQIVSVQVNHQSSETCTNGDSEEVPNQNEISALSVALLQSTDLARLNLGWAACSVTLPNCD